MFGPYRNLVDGLGFGLALFVGANAGMFCCSLIAFALVPLSPYLSGGASDIGLGGCALGFVAGGWSWKLLKSHFRRRVDHT